MSGWVLNTPLVGAKWIIFYVIIHKLETDIIEKEFLKLRVTIQRQYKDKLIIWLNGGQFYS